MTWMVETYWALHPPRWTMIAHTDGGVHQGGAGADVAAFDVAIRLAKQGQTEAALKMLRRAVG